MAFVISLECHKTSPDWKKYFCCFYYLGNYALFLEEGKLTVDTFGKNSSFAYKIEGDFHFALDLFWG